MKPGDKNERNETDLSAYPKIRRTEPQIENRYDTLLLFASLFIAIGVMLGVNATLPGEDSIRNAMVLFVGIVAGTLSFAANKAAFHVGSKLAARGDRMALALCLSWFVFLGGNVGTIGFTGVSYEIIEAAELRVPLTAIETAKSNLTTAGSQTRGVSEVVSAARSDIEGLVACEIRRGCISGRSGVGRQVSELQRIVARFRTFERSVSGAGRDRTSLLARLSKLSSQYEERLSQGGVGAANRAELLSIYSRAQPLLAELGAASPMASIGALVGELRSFRTSGNRGRIDLSSRLRDHADRIEATLPTGGEANATLPPFPKPSGIAAGWKHLELTWPYAILLFGLELIVVVLWIILVRRLVALQDAQAAAADHKVDEYDDEDHPLNGGGSSRRGPTIGGSKRSGPNGSDAWGRR
ncbi:MAG: hypothetical protein AAFR01_08620 [Pseudomonadota bacterium]